MFVKWLSSLGLTLFLTGNSFFPSPLQAQEAPSSPAHNVSKQTVIHPTTRKKQSLPPNFQSIKALTKQIAAQKLKSRSQDIAKEREEAAQKHPSTDNVQTILPKREGDEDEEESGTEFLEARLFALKQRAFPRDRVNLRAYPRAIRHREKMLPAHVGKSGIGLYTLGGSWEFVGPKNTPPPDRINFGTGTLNGRVNALAYDFVDTNTCYLGAASGGVWKTLDGGISWTPLSDSWPSLEVGSLAIHPTNHNLLLAGTGDFDGLGGGGFGLMRSDDGGNTWQNLGSTEFGGVGISRIAWDPEDPNIITVASGRPSTNKLYHSIDGGATWQVAVTVNTEWDDVAYGAMDSTGKRCLYAVGRSAAGEIWRSDDRGLTWKKLAAPLSHSDQFFLRVATSPTDPQTVYMTSGIDEVILKSTNMGNNWTDVTNDFPTGGSINWSQSFYDIHIACSTRNVNGSPVDVVYVGLVDLVQSPNGGTHWQSIGGPTYTDTSLLHNDQHCMTFNPNNPNEALVGCDGGILRLTYSPTKNTWSYNSLSSPGGLMQIYKMAAHPTDSTFLLLGTQDNASPGALGDLENWQNVGLGDGGFCAILDANTQYSTSKFLHILKTTNGWQSNFDITPNLGNDRAAFIAPLALSADGLSLYAATNYFYRKTEPQGAWESHVGGQALSVTGSVLTLAIAPSDPSHIYTGSDDGALWMTATSGNSWTQVNLGVPSLPVRSITSIAVNPTNPNDILVGLSGTGTTHLWRCTDTTAIVRVWLSVSGIGVNALPDISLNAIALDIDSPSTAWYVGTDVGVFSTWDSGLTWQNANQPLGLPNVQVNDLKVVPATRTLYAATYGRGLWKIQLPSAPLYSVSGKVKLDSCVNMVQPITFEFRPLGGGTKFVRTQTLTSTGTFLLSKIPAGNYKLAIKGRKWLRKVVSVNASSGNVTTVAATLLPGDIVENNAVDLDDLGALALAFDTTVADALWDTNADLNCDGSVNLDDLGLLALNFDKVGDP